AAISISICSTDGSARKPLAPADRERGCEDGCVAANSAVIVRLDRAIQYAGRSRFHFICRRLLDTRFRGYDRRAGMTGKNDEGRQMNQPASAYFMEERHEPAESHTL